MAWTDASFPPAGVATATERLSFQPPFDATSLFSFLAARAVPGVEEGNAFGYRRTAVLPHGAGVIELGEPGAKGDPTQRWNEQGWIPCTLWLCDKHDRPSAVARSRRLLDLGADSIAIDAVLGADAVLAQSVRLTPGRRAPGHVDGFEVAVRAVLGQQISVAGARTIAARLATSYGASLPIVDASLTVLFPSPEALSVIDPWSLPMPRARARTVITLAQAVVDGGLTLHPGSDREEAVERLLALPGIGPWTASYIAMRALGDPDVFLPTDLGVRHGLQSLGLSGDPKSADEVSRNWRPWRSYALQHVWAAAALPSRGKVMST